MKPDKSELAALIERYGQHAVMCFALEIEAEASRQAEGWHWMAHNLRTMGGKTVGERMRIAERLLWKTWRSGGYRGEVQPVAAPVESR